MNKNIRSLAVHLLLGATFVMGVVHAAEEEQDHIPVGERALSKVESLAIQEKRALQSKEQEELENRDAQGVARSVEGANFYSTHPGAYHAPRAVSLLGDTVELEDGSMWVVKKSDRSKTFDWLTSDSLVITPNHSWFSGYSYRITNLNTGKSVQVDLSLGPIYNGPFTHWIAAVDYYNGQICLEDGSVWDVSGFDQSILNKWLLNDTVIIGIDDTLLGRTNILINVNTLNYVSADCIY